MNADRRTLLSATAVLTLSAFATSLMAQTAPVPPAPPVPSAAAVPSAAPAATPASPTAPATPDAALTAPSSPIPPEVAQTQPPTPPGETISPPGSTSPRNWTTDQILTATVHQAWVLAGKDEGNFFEIVRELAEISAQNRNLTLPDNPEAGKKAGAFIRAQAKEDHDQLLYDIVDKAVRMTGTKSASEAAGVPAPSSVR